MHSIERVLQIKRLLTYNLLAWCLLAVLAGIQQYSYALSFSQNFDWKSIIRYPLSVYLSYWALSYMVLDFFLMSRKWTRPRLILFHLLMSLLFGLFHKTLAYICGLLLERLFLPAESLDWQELIKLWADTWFDIISGITVYWLMLFVLTALDYWQRFRDQSEHSLTLKHQLSEAQLHSMRMQLQPHFLFNALNTIAMMVRRKEQDKAISMIIGLSEMLRNNLSLKKKQFISLDEELSLINHYLTVEQARFQDRLQVELHIEENTRQAQVPNLVLQPIVENAFKHGIAHSLDQARLRISSYYENERLILEVYNSTDVAPHDWIMAKSKGIGLHNTIDRLRQLYKGKAQIRFIAQEDGVLVRISLPALEANDKFTIKKEIISE
ncbi:sensor histidine kinase [Catalinimonas niigatensis]|uniref:sensor histidine kinase n=1 Tax=Catalinimonas niigatensis TaxID=1397264 RepID=UPI0026668F33|nr:histidine kinase [Catalinimonas niigatensis]WPP50084.1 histidine kinase [Catalinimonas niigatensis]